MKFVTKSWIQTQFNNFAEKIASVFAKKSDIPTVNNGTLTIQKNGVNVQTFTANQSTNSTANITVPTKALDVGAVATSKVLTTQEQIDANTDTSNVAGAAAVKSLKSDLTNSIGQINRNLTDSLKQFEVVANTYIFGTTKYTYTFDEPVSRQTFLMVLSGLGGVNPTGSMGMYMFYKSSYDGTVENLPIHEIYPIEVSSGRAMEITVNTKELTITVTEGPSLFYTVIQLIRLYKREM